MTHRRIVRPPPSMSTTSTQTYSYPSPQIYIHLCAFLPLVPQFRNLLWKYLPTPLNTTEIITVCIYLYILLYLWNYSVDSERHPLAAGKIHQVNMEGFFLLDKKTIGSIKWLKMSHQRCEIIQLFYCNN